MKRIVHTIKDTCYYVYDNIAGVYWVDQISTLEYGPFKNLTEALVHRTSYLKGLNSLLESPSVIEIDFVNKKRKQKGVPTNV